MQWDEMVDRVMTVDGLAWGARSKGLGAHLVFPMGKVYLRGIDLIDADLDGRLVRVSGILRKAAIGPVPQGVQGYPDRFDYFYLDLVQAGRIDKVVHDQLLPSNDAWIMPGLPINDALALIRSRQLSPFGLALAASPDGAVAHSYELSEGEVLLLYELNGVVQSVFKVQVSGGDKGTKMTPVPGCRLPEGMPADVQSDAGRPDTTTFSK